MTRQSQNFAAGSSARGEHTRNPLTSAPPAIAIYHHLPDGLASMVGTVSLLMCQGMRGIGTD